jgi:hypothetical protein
MCSLFLRSISHSFPNGLVRMPTTWSYDETCSTCISLHTTLSLEVKLHLHVLYASMKDYIVYEFHIALIITLGGDSSFILDTNLSK